MLKKMSAIEHTDTAKAVGTLRKRLRLTQEQFAATLGVTFSTVNRWERGHVTPSPLAMQRLEELRRELEGEEHSEGSERWAEEPGQPF
jgi:putative transcriptional regulator